MDNKNKPIKKQHNNKGIDLNNFGKIPPQSKDAEDTIIGAIILEKQAFHVCSEFLNADVFYFPKNQCIFKACEKISSNNEPIDFVTVVEQLKKNGELEDVGGAYALSQLMHNLTSTANLEYYCRIVLQSHMLRTLSTLFGNKLNECFEPTADCFDIMDSVSVEIQNMLNYIEKPNIETLQELHLKMLDKLELQKLNDTSITGIPSYWNNVNEITHGWQNSDLIIIAARPSVGKTAFALQIAQCAAMAGYPVLFFNLEMSKEQLYERYASSLSDVPLKYIKTGQAIDSDHKTKAEYADDYDKKLERSFDTVKNHNLVIDDTATLNIVSLKSRIASHFLGKNKPKLIILDYLQLMSGTDKHGQNREQEISTISRNLKVLAKEYKVPFIALSQLSRGVESRSSNEPNLADLRECISVNTSSIYTNKIFQSNAASQINLLSLHKEKINNMGSVNIPKTKNKVFRLKLKTGRFIDCTAKHKILTSDGYKMLKDITETDAVAVALNWENKSGIYIKESKFIGWMLGNGSMYGYGVPSFITKDKIISDNFCDFVFNNFGFYPKSHPHYASKVYQWDITNTPTGNKTKEGNIVTRWLKEMDLWGRKSMDKYIPTWWMETANEQSICDLIQGLWETDGSIAMGKKETISYSTTSLILANQILYLTAKIGIVCHLDNGHLSNKATTNCYKLTISSSEQKKKFINKIVLHGEKGEKMSKMKISVRQSYHSNVLGRNTTLSIENDIKKYTSRRYVNSYQNRRLTKLSLKNILSAINIFDVKNKYNWLLTDSIYWDGVESITPLGIEPVFDRSVPVSNNFVVNGIVVHNSGAIEQDADVVCFLYNKNGSNDDRPTIAEIEVKFAKNRSGALGIVNLYSRLSRQQFMENDPTKKL